MSRGLQKSRHRVVSAMTGAQFREIRDHLDMTLDQLSKRIGLDRSSIWRMEHEKYDIPKVVAELMILLDRYERPKGKRKEPRARAKGSKAT